MTLFLTMLDGLAAPANTLEAIGSALLNALTTGQWSIAVALVVMMLVWVAQKTPVLEKLVSNRNVRVYVAMGVSMVASIVANFFASQGNWVTSVVQGLTTGLASAGLWSALGKYVAARIEGKPVD